MAMFDIVRRRGVRRSTVIRQQSDQLIEDPKFEVCCSNIAFVNFSVNTLIFTMLLSWFRSLVWRILEDKLGRGFA